MFGVRKHICRKGMRRYFDEVLGGNVAVCEVPSGETIYDQYDDLLHCVLRLSVTLCAPNVTVDMHVLLVNVIHNAACTSRPSQ